MEVVSIRIRSASSAKVWLDECDDDVILVLSERECVRKEDSVVSVERTDIEEN